jgi:hypothetical protein
MSARDGVVCVRREMCKGPAAKPAAVDAVGRSAGGRRGRRRPAITTTHAAARRTRWKLAAAEWLGSSASSLGGWRRPRG